MSNNKRYVRIAVYTALFSVLATILNFIEIPYILFLKLDVSEAITLLATSFSLYSGIIVSVVKFIFMSLTGTTTGLIGETTMFIGSITVVITYFVVNKVFKSSKIISLLITVIMFTTVMTTLNYFFITPFYYGSTYRELQEGAYSFGIFENLSYLYYILTLYVPFNLIKMTLSSVIFYFLSNFLEKVPGYEDN